MRWPVSWPVTWLVSSALALGAGFASALLPLVNAEVYVVAAAGRAGPGVAVAVVLALAVGQTAGKLLLFETARHGGGRLARWSASRTRRGDRAGRWSARLSAALRSRRTGDPLVLVSAALGLPPLAVVSLAAGACGQKRWEFGLLCLIGRITRFAALALSAAWALS